METKATSCTYQGEARRLSVPKYFSIEMYAFHVERQEHYIAANAIGFHGFVGSIYNVDKNGEAD